MNISKDGLERKKNDILKVNNVFVITTLVIILGFNVLMFDEYGLGKLERVVKEPELPKSKWIFHNGNPIHEAIECPHCGVCLDWVVGKWDFCPECGWFNGRRL